MWKKIKDKINEGNINIFWENIIGNNIGEERMHSKIKFFSLIILNLSEKYKLMNIKDAKFKYDPKLSVYKTSPIKLKISVKPDTKKSGWIRSALLSQFNDSYFNVKAPKELW